MFKPLHSISNITFIVIFICSYTTFTQAQAYSDTYICEKIQEYKTDPRGPFKDIRWFCPDGTINMPRVPCTETGGHQHARHKDIVNNIAKNRHIFLAQILTNTEPSDLWDANNNHSRIKQYILEDYLKRIDDGWVLQTGQYYRGAFQVEDERKWGKDFLEWVLQYKSRVIENFYLVREATRIIPHHEETNRTYNIRAVSLQIADNYPAFQDIRIKIHGQPDATDLKTVQNFYSKHQDKLKPNIKDQFTTLINDLETEYTASNIPFLKKNINLVSSQTNIGKDLRSFIQTFENDQKGVAYLTAVSDLLLHIRQEIPNIGSRQQRLALMDISVSLEQIYFREISNWSTQNLQELSEQICYTAQAVAGAGYMELWEWDALSPQLEPFQTSTATLQQLKDYTKQTRKAIEWGTSTIIATFDEVVQEYAGFEPLAVGFIDDQVRGSLLLRLGQQIQAISQSTETLQANNHQIFNRKDVQGVRGLNAGYARGKLVLIDPTMSIDEVDNKNIYLFQRPPSDLKPVAGIATVSEGNPVSHVQLLARNLGIPNSVLSIDMFEALQKYNGENIFYAVSTDGSVVMKLAKNMSDEENDLFAEVTRSTNKVTVPVDNIRLSQTDILNMRNVSASDSGILCGPKAANLGELKQLFPDAVVEGLVIPFGIFKQHMEQNMPNMNMTYWQFLTNTFKQAKGMEEHGSSDAAINDFVLRELAVLRKAIKNIQLSSAFKTQLRAQFVQVFGNNIGRVPVFLRSDTNMEDLENFTGAGLNLTKFNIVQEQAILDGIKEVWASPYTERSYKWRQQYLLNPENVFPSILIIPTVDVDYSGVLITTGIESQDPTDLTVAFSRGAGGAVDGQAAESYLLRKDQSSVLLAPARERMYRRLPTSGGSLMKATTFETPILNAKNLNELRSIAYEVDQRFPKKQGVGGPYDIELGFKDDKAYLFQVRPFVENDQAAQSEYLNKLNNTTDMNTSIDLTKAF